MKPWAEPERFELIDGAPYLLTSLSVEGADISTQLTTVFNRYIRENKPECRVYRNAAGILFEESGRNVVRPEMNGDRARGEPHQSMWNHAINRGAGH